MPQLFYLTLGGFSYEMYQGYMSTYVGCRLNAFLLLSSCSFTNAAKQAECLAALDILSATGGLNAYRYGTQMDLYNKDIHFISVMLTGHPVLQRHLLIRIQNPAVVNWELPPNPMSWTCADSDKSKVGMLLDGKLYKPSTPNLAFRQEWLGYLLSDPLTKQAVDLLLPVLQQVDKSLSSVFNGSDIRMCFLVPTTGGIAVSVFGDSVSAGRSDSKSLVNTSLAQIWYMLNHCNEIVKVEEITRAEASRSYSMHKSVIIAAVNEIMGRLQDESVDQGVLDSDEAQMYAGFVASEDKKTYFNKALMLATYRMLFTKGSTIVNPVRASRLLLRCIGYTSNRSPHGGSTLFDGKENSDKLDLYQYVNTSDPADPKDSLYAVGPFKDFIQWSAKALDTVESDTSFVGSPYYTVEYSNTSIQFIDASGRPILIFSCSFEDPPTRYTKPDGSWVYLMDIESKIRSCRADGRLDDVYTLARIYG